MSKKWYGHLKKIYSIPEWQNSEKVSEFKSDVASIVIKINTDVSNIYI